MRGGSLLATKHLLDLQAVLDPHALAQCVQEFEDGIASLRAAD